MDLEFSEEATKRIEQLQDLAPRGVPVGFAYPTARNSEYPWLHTDTGRILLPKDAATLRSDFRDAEVYAQRAVNFAEQWFRTTALQTSAKEQV